MLGQVTDELTKIRIHYSECTKTKEVMILYIYQVIGSVYDFHADNEGLMTDILYCGFSKWKSNQVFYEAIVKNLGYESVTAYNEVNSTSSFEEDFSQQIRGKSYYYDDSDQVVKIWIKTIILDISKKKEQILAPTKDVDRKNWNELYYRIGHRLAITQYGDKDTGIVNLALEDLDDHTVLDDIDKPDSIKEKVPFVNTEPDPEFVGELMDTIEDFLSKNDDTIVVLRGKRYDGLAAKIKECIHNWQTE